MAEFNDRVVAIVDVGKKIIRDGETFAVKVIAIKLNILEEM